MFRSLHLKLHFLQICHRSKYTWELFNFLCKTETMLSILFSEFPNYCSHSKMHRNQCNGPYYGVSFSKWHLSIKANQSKLQLWQGRYHLSIRKGREGIEEDICRAEEERGHFFYFFDPQRLLLYGFYTPMLVIFDEAKKPIIKFIQLTNFTMKTQDRISN